MRRTRPSRVPERHRLQPNTQRQSSFPEEHISFQEKSTAAAEAKPRSNFAKLPRGSIREQLAEHLALAPGIAQVPLGVSKEHTSIKAQLGPLLNGFVAYGFWLPVPKMDFPNVADLIKKYQARAPAEGVDPLGYHRAPEAYAQLQVLEQAVEGTKSLDDQKLADYIRTHTFTTVLGEVRFGKGGEWAQSRVLQVQFRNIKSNDPMQFKGVDTQAVVSPPQYASGALIYPYEKAR